MDDVQITLTTSSKVIEGHAAVFFALILQEDGKMSVIYLFTCCKNYSRFRNLFHRVIRYHCPHDELLGLQRRTGSMTLGRKPRDGRILINSSLIAYSAMIVETLA